MKASTLVRHAREGVKNLGRNGWMSFASIISVSITLLILGVFLILALNMNSMTEQMEEQVEIRVFLDLTSGEAEQKAVERKLLSIPEIKEITFVSKEEGIEQFVEELGEQGKYFEDFKNENNPLPDVFVVKTENPQDTPKVAKQIEGFEHIYLVNYGAGTIEKLFTFTNTIRNVGIFLVIGLAFTAMLLIANTIKITITARSREIEIMRLVGATNSFIRWPFFIEGLMIGLIGATLPILVLYLGYQELLNITQNDVKLEIFKLLPMNPLIYDISFLLLGIGAFIGVWGSLMSIRKFLRV